jgi:hypothetical protein
MKDVQHYWRMSSTTKLLNRHRKHDGIKKKIWTYSWRTDLDKLSGGTVCVLNGIFPVYKIKLMRLYDVTNSQSHHVDTYYNSWKVTVVITYALYRKVPKPVTMVCCSDCGTELYFAYHSYRAALRGLAEFLKHEVKGEFLRQIGEQMAGN